MPRPKQFSFLPPASKSHGGTLRAGKRKTARPIDPKQAMHIVLRSSRARGEWSMLHPKNRVRVDSQVRRVAFKHGVRMYRYTNVGNHLHLLAKTPSRRAFKAFLREVSGAVATVVTGAKKGRPFSAGFWDTIPFTRIVAWGRDFLNLELYFIKNLFEAAGLLTQKAKSMGLKPIPIYGRWVGADGDS